MSASRDADAMYSTEAAAAATSGAAPHARVHPGRLMPRAATIATPIDTHTGTAMRPVQSRNAAGTCPGIHGNTSSREQNNGSDVAADSLTIHATATHPTIITGSHQIGGSNPMRTSSPPDRAVT